MPESPVELPSLGGSLAVSFLSLGLVCFLAYVGLHWLARRGAGGGSSGIRLLSRLPLEPKRSLCVVEVAGRLFLIGCSETGVALISELDKCQAPILSPR
jgi:flagellar protein FliO/FliZ